MEPVTAQTQEINLFHQRVGLIQCTAATSYCFSSCFCEQDFTPRNTVHLIETLVNSEGNRKEKKKKKRKKTLLLNVISSTEVQYHEFVKLRKSIFNFLSVTHICNTFPHTEGRLACSQARACAWHCGAFVGKG